MEKALTTNVNEYYSATDLKIYADTEWVNHNQKKYRYCFHKKELSYVYAEFSFHNKLHGLANWDISFDLICERISPSSKQICNLKLNKKVSQDEVVVHFREGWGNKITGNFWQEGLYRWTVRISDDNTVSQTFNVLDVGSGPEHNHFFNINKISFFEGMMNDMTEVKDFSYSEFAANKTRGVFTALEIDNIAGRDWNGEFHFKYYNEEGDLKAIIPRQMLVYKDAKKFNVITGFGSNTKGQWSEGVYRVEITFLGRFIGMAFFRIGKEFKKENPKIITSLHHLELVEEPIIPKMHFDQAFSELDNMIGLVDIKSKIRDHAQYLNFLKIRKAKGFKETESLHLHTVFTGNPGTGKTTVAKMLGNIYYSLGLLSKGHVHEVDRADLVGEFIGQTAPKVKEAIKQAKGGVLFIDEAYALARSQEDTKDFGREVIEILVKELTVPDNDLAVIVAGYPKEMSTFLSVNPGLKHKFKHHFEFADYQPNELIEISEVASQKQGVTLDDNARNFINQLIIEAYRNRQSDFSNARFVYDIIEKAKINLGLRIMQRNNPEKLTSNDLKTIILKDVVPLKSSKTNPLLQIPKDKGLLEEALTELDNLIGMQHVKQQVRELVDIIRFHTSSGKLITSQYSHHTVFIGNPGTGKTTVARILAKIFKALGLLERGHLVETDRQGMVAGYVGQTAMKTSEVIDRAEGGVLFIDEAYALSQITGSMGDFGGEAIQTLLKRMEDQRGVFYVFAAGYPDQMEQFLKANPGLSSRFDKKIIFHDYDQNELFDIAKKMLSDQGYHLSKKAKIQLKEHINQVNTTKDKYFGNARTIRQLIAQIVHFQNLRVSTLDESSSSKRIYNQIKETDVEHCIQQDNNQSVKKRQIGFNS